MRVEHVDAAVENRAKTLDRAPVQTPATRNDLDLEPGSAAAVGHFGVWPARIVKDSKDRATAAPTQMPSEQDQHVFGAVKTFAAD
jgi:hypothetical protein